MTVALGVIKKSGVTTEREERLSFESELNDVQCGVTRDRADREFSSILALLDYLVRSRQYLLRNRQTELFGSF
jgi:hypothetical protein